MNSENGRGNLDETQFVSKREYETFMNNFLAWKAQVDVRLERMGKLEAEVSELKVTAARIDERTKLMQKQSTEQYKQIATAIETLVDKVSELSARQKNAPAD